MGIFKRRRRKRGKQRAQATSVKATSGSSIEPPTLPPLPEGEVRAFLGSSVYNGQTLKFDGICTQCAVGATDQAQWMVCDTTGIAKDDCPTGTVWTEDLEAFGACCSPGGLGEHSIGAAGGASAAASGSDDCAAVVGDLKSRVENPKRPYLQEGRRRAFYGPSSYDPDDDGGTLLFQTNNYSPVDPGTGCQNHFGGTVGPYAWSIGHAIDPHTGIPQVGSAVYAKHCPEMQWMVCDEATEKRVFEAVPGKITSWTIDSNQQLLPGGTVYNKQMAQLKANKAQAGIVCPPGWVWTVTDESWVVHQYAGMDTRFSPKIGKRGCCCTPAGSLEDYAIPPSS